MAGLEAASWSPAMPTLRSLIACALGSSSSFFATAMATKHAKITKTERIDLREIILIISFYLVVLCLKLFLKPERNGTKRVSNHVVPKFIRSTLVDIEVSWKTKTIHAEGEKYGTRSSESNCF